MAVSGYFETNIAPIEGSGSTDPKSVGTDWTASYEADYLRWKITWVSRAKGNSSYPSRWTTVQNGTTSFTSSYTLDPASPSATMPQPQNSKHNQELVSGWFYIYINSDGDASFTGYMTYHVNSTGTSGLCTAEQVFYLDNVPLASKVSASVGSISITSTSGSINYYVTSKSNYYHQISYGQNESSASIAQANLNINNTTYTGTLAVTDILNKFPSSASGTLYIYVKTYKNSGPSNQVGSTQSVPITVSISPNGSGIKPSANAGSISINSSPISGKYVAGQSSAKTNTSGSATYGAWITKIEYSFNNNGTAFISNQFSGGSGTIYSGTLPGGTSNYNLTATCIVTDSRGGTATSTTSAVTVYGYSGPTVSANIYRTSASSGSSPARDEAGLYVYISFSGSQPYTVGGSNSLSTTCTASGYITGQKASGTFVSLPEDKSAIFTVKAQDSITSASVVVTIAAAKYALELYDDKNGTLWAKAGGTIYANGVKSASWIDAQKSELKTGIRVGDATDTTSAWPWMSGKNTASGKSFAIAQLGNSLYFIGSDTSRTSNGYDQGFVMDFSSGVFTAPSFSGTVSYATSAGSATNATNATNASYATSAGSLSSTLGIGSGGTGATSASGARSNLGIGVARLYSGSISSSGASCTVSNASSYKFLIIGGYAYNTSNNAQTNVFVYTGELSSTERQYIISDDYDNHYIRFGVTLSGSTATITIKSISGSGAALNAIYGVN